MFIIPTSKDKGDDFYGFDLELDGVAYHFDFRWNERASSWFMNLSLTDGTALISGIKLTAGSAPIHWWVNVENGIPGFFFVYDTSGKNQDPGRYDLSPDGRCVLYYFEKADVDALNGFTDDDALAALAAAGQ